MSDIILWSACLSGWLFDVLLVADQMISGGAL